MVWEWDLPAHQSVVAAAADPQSGKYWHSPQGGSSPSTYVCVCERMRAVASTNGLAKGGWKHTSWDSCPLTFFSLPLLSSCSMSAHVSDSQQHSPYHKLWSPTALHCTPYTPTCLSSSPGEREGKYAVKGWEESSRPFWKQGLVFWETFSAHEVKSLSSSDCRVCIMT